MNLARFEQRPNVADVNDFHGRSAFARMLRKKLPRRVDSRFSRTQHDDAPAHVCCRSSQSDIRPDDGHGRTLDNGHRGPERAAGENDSVRIGCQREKTLLCAGAQLVGKRSRLIHGLAKVRPHFMVKIFGPQSKRFGCLLKHLAVPIHRMQKRNAHCRVPRYQVCHVDAASRFHADGAPLGAAALLQRRCGLTRQAPLPVSPIPLLRERSATI
ncbi:hypothetical protein [Paraburkholderia sp. BL17N1]|uniref:hypothetical protein n=1 Tax=Paraburkholderia sp. BL17N1 TaxID=1938798 RepID=UPI00131540A6|nr:hypothetical protein [Paraburkholderia sp. BL17N1]